MLFVLMLAASQVLVGSISSHSWSCFRKAANRIESFHVAEFEEEAEISMSVFAQVLSKLVDKPCLPSLKSIHITNLETFFNYSPFLISPALEDVNLDVPAVIPSSWTSGDGQPMDAFLQMLVSRAPKMKCLRINHSDILNASSLSFLNQFSSLRVLEINAITGIQSMTDICSSLSTLINLEELRLTIKIGKNWGMARESESPSNTNDLRCLTLLKSLSLRGPSQILSEFLDSLETARLTSLTLASTSWLHVKDASPTVGKKKAQRRKSFRLSCTSKCTAVHENEWNLNRWRKSLKDLTISSSNRTTYNINRIIGYSALQHLTVAGGTTPVEGLLVPEASIWEGLQSLHFSSGSSSVSLSQLREIAKRAPKLTSFSSPVTADRESQLLPPHQLEPLRHSLEEFIVNGVALIGEQQIDVNSCCPRLACKIARQINLLFPNLKQLQYAPGESLFWEEVWEMVKLSQNVVRDEKRREEKKMSKICSLV
jgi:hypothetical protein